VRRLATIALVLVPAAAQAQQNGNAVTLPDSSYLTLTLVRSAMVNYNTRQEPSQVEIFNMEAGQGVLAGLHDAIQRCDTWNTSPLPVIRAH
jgi:hypothetical protein